MNKAHAPTLANYEKALHRMLDENAALQAANGKLRTELSNLVDWVMGDKDALTCLQAIYNNATTSEANRVRAAAAAIGFERAKPATANLVMIDFRERVRQARLKAPLKTIEHIA